MAKECKDFIFDGKKISDFKEKSYPKYIFVNFDSDTDIPLSLSRDMEKGESNRYRTEANYFYDTWTDTIPLEFNIVKNPNVYHTQTEMEISKDEIREITRWLTSSHLPKWLKVESEDYEPLRYKGWFNNIENWTVAGIVYGLKLSFKCTTPFAYTEEIVNESTVSSYKNIIVSNDSDELNTYTYPSLELEPTENCQIYICNLSDCVLRENGILQLTQSSYFDSMLDIIETHARKNGCTIEYIASEKDDAFNIVPLCNDTVVQFYLVDSYGYKQKCTAFFMEDTKEYRIIEGGFMYMTMYKGLKVYMDCQKLTINDSLGRMITYDKLGINNADMVYWLRLINGHNTLLLYGKCKFTIKHIESRKVGE